MRELSRRRDRSDSNLEPPLDVSSESSLVATDDPQSPQSPNILDNQSDELSPARPAKSNETSRNEVGSDGNVKSPRKRATFAHNLPNDT